MDHRFEVRAVDQAGNFDLTPAEFTWRIEAGVEEEGTEEAARRDPGRRLHRRGRPPTTRITSAPGELITDEAGTRFGTTNESAKFAFTGNDNLTAGYNLALRVPQVPRHPQRRAEPADMPEQTRRWSRAVSGAVLRPGLRRPHRRGARGRPGRQQGHDPGVARLVDPAAAARHDAPGHRDRLRAGPDDRADERDVQFSGSDNQTPTEALGYQCRLDGAMSARPAAVDRLHLAVRGDMAPAPGRARPPGPGRRPERERRRRERERRQPRAPDALDPTTGCRRPTSGPSARLR